MIDDREQVRILDRLRYGLDDELEFTIRSMAANAAADDRVYAPGGLRYPWSDGLRYPLDVDAEISVRWNDIWIRLIPALRSYPHAAKLVAERIIREQLAEIRGTEHKKVHTLYHPEWEESEERMGSPFHERRYSLFARLDDKIISTSYVLPEVMAVQAASEKGLMKSVRRRLRDQFLAELGKHLGFDDA